MHARFCRDKYKLHHQNKKIMQTLWAEGGADCELVAYPSVLVHFYNDY